MSKFSYLFLSNLLDFSDGNILKFRFWNYHNKPLDNPLRRDSVNGQN